MLLNHLSSQSVKRAKLKVEIRKEDVFSSYIRKRNKETQQTPQVFFFGGGRRDTFLK